MAQFCLVVRVVLPRQAVNRVPIFSPLSTEQKRLVSNALLEVHFPPGLYICEEVRRADLYVHAL